MECTDTDIDADSEREEGEIFDDDLETISDDPMITPSPTMGKLNKTEGSLCALSLSSVSDLEILECSSSHSNPKYRRCGAVKKKKRLSRSYYSKSSSGSSSENEETRKTKKLLKDAIRRDTEIMQNNSLRTRLKNMIQKPMILEGPEANSPNDCDNLQDEHPCCGFVTETNASEDKEKGERETLSMDRDDELIQLRLEALKTAVINKFQRKKKMISNNQEESKTLETNKENSSDNVNTQVCNLDNVNCIEEIVERSPVVNTSSPNSAINSEEDIDEDEDILRAVLLASMAKKMTTKVPISKRNNTISNKLIKKELKPPHMVAKPNIDLPKAKPFIISINNPDSDSNEEFMDTEEIKSDKIIDEKELELKIDNFLKQQRAEVEAKSINISQTNINTNSQTNKNVETNSLYKLLPKNKQLEYEKLIQKLKTAEKKCKIKRISSRITDHKLQKNKSLSRTTESNSVTAVALQRQLRQMQQQVSGSDEAHFWFNGYVNKQNCRIWSENNPQEVLQVPLHPEKCTVWCALHAGGIIDPYFFKNDAGANVTVNGAHYRLMINDYLFQNLNGIDPEVFWFQQDSATSYAATITIDLLKDINGPINWLPRSYDITPLDYFIWGYVKSLVYADKPETIDALEANITRVIDEII